MDDILNISISKVIKLEIIQLIIDHFIYLLFFKKIDYYKIMYLEWRDLFDYFHLIIRIRNATTFLIIAHMRIIIIIN